MPRSGTSLVEQIITSHSQVFGGGELPILSNIVKNNFITDNNFSPLKFKKIVNDELEINNLRLEFLKFLKYFKFDEKYITDKSPLNFRWIGFIKLIFPSAKIINCIRDPKNNCLSMFKNLFLALLLIFPLTALAHSPLESSFPSDGEKLDTAPPEIILVFKSPAKLIKVDMKKLSEKKRKGYKANQPTLNWH